MRAAARGRRTQAAGPRTRRCRCCARTPTGCKLNGCPLVPRSSASPLFIGALVAIGCRVAGAVTDSASTQVLLTDDQQCELWTMVQLRQLVDTWRTRYSVLAWCNGIEESARSRGRTWSGEGEIIVTITPANGQEPLEAWAVESVKSSVGAALNSLGKAEGWHERYPRRVLNFVP